MSVRHHKNKTQAILSPMGQLIYDHKQITKESLSYYYGLYNGENSVYFLYVDTRILINKQGKRYLYSPIFDEEVKEALWSIHDTKSLG